MLLAFAYFVGVVRLAAHPGDLVLRIVQFVGRSSVSTDRRRFLHGDKLPSHFWAQIFFIDTISRQP